MPGKTKSSPWNTLDPSANSVVTLSRWQGCTYLGVLLIVTVWSGVSPTDRFTWWLEVVPVFIGISMVLISHRRFALTKLLYTLLLLHALILLVGGHYTYAQVPLGYWVQTACGFARNHYDRLGTSLRALSRPSWQEKYCCEGRRYSRGNGYLSSC